MIALAPRRIDELRSTTRAHYIRVNWLERYASRGLIMADCVIYSIA